MKTNDIFERVAKQYNTTAAEVYEEIQIAIDAGFDNPDPDIQAEWRKMSFKGERPTPEEVIESLLCMLQSKGSQTM